MNIARTIYNAVAEFRSNLESPRVRLTGDNIASWLGGQYTSRSGVSVGWRDALSYSPVWSAVSLITEDIMRIPFLTYRREMRDDRPFCEEALNHPVHKILNGAISPMGSPGRVTSNVWIQRMLGHALLFKGAFSRIYRNGTDVSRLEWVHSDRVQVDIQDARKVFMVSYNSPEAELGHQNIELVPEEDMFHIQGLQLDDWGGLSLIDFARNSIGRQLAAEDYGDEYFSNAAVPNGWFKTPLAMNREAQSRFAKKVAAMHGKGNRHRFGILEEGMEWQATGASPKDAMLIESLQFGIPEVARWFKIPLNKLADPSRSGYNTTEQENIAFLNSTLGAWISKLEFQADDKLFSERAKSQRRYYTKFKIRDYLKSDTKSRAEMYSKGIQWGWFTRNEVRQEEDLNPLENLDEPLTPLNMTTGLPDDDDKDSESNETDQTQDEPQRSIDLKGAMLLCRSIVNECANRLHKSAMTSAKNPRRFMADLNDWEARHSRVISDKLEAVLQFAQSLGANCDPQASCDHLIGESRERFLSASECQPESLIGNVENVKLDSIIDRATSLIWKVED